MKRLFIYTYITIALLVTVSLAQAQPIDRKKAPKAGPAPVISFKDPVIYKLPNGLTVLIVEDHKLPSVNASLFIDKGPVTEGNKSGVLDLMGGMLNEGTLKKSKAVFDEQVDLIGAEVSLNSGGGSVSSLTRYFPEAFQLMTEALLTPSFPQESFNKLKSQTLTGIKASERSVKAISARVVSGLAYGLDHPSGELTTETTVNAVTLDDVKKAYQNYITPARAYLTIVGDVSVAKAKELVQKELGSWKSTALGLEKLPVVANPSKTEIDLIDVPNATQSEITIINLINLPLNNPDYFAVVLANKILGDGTESRLFKNLREKHGFTYGPASSAGSGRFQTSFRASASVRNEKVDSAVGQFMYEIGRLRTQKITAEELKNAKMIYNGGFALGMENPSTTATFASNILINNLPKDFYRTYLTKINAVTIDDIQRVSKKYFNYDNTRIVVAGKQSAVLPGLEKLGYPVKKYDSYAKPVKNEIASVAAQPSLSGAEIIEKYLTAIGGKEAAASINTTIVKGTLSVQGQELPYTLKRMAPNYSNQEISFGGQVMMKSLFDGSAGYSTQMGQKKEFTADEIAEKKSKQHLVEQLDYTSAGYQLKAGAGEMVNGQATYLVQVTPPSGKVIKENYEVKTGYLVRSEEMINSAAGSLQRVTEFSNYKKVGNLFMPYTLKVVVQTPQGDQELNFNLSSIKINETLSAADFK